MIGELLRRVESLEQSQRLLAAENMQVCDRLLSAVRCDFILLVNECVGIDIVGITRVQVTCTTKESLNAPSRCPAHEMTYLFDIESVIESERYVYQRAIKTPLIQLHADDLRSAIWLKLENLQPTASFKVRGSTNAVLRLGAERIKEGLIVASAGNMAQGVARNAKSLGCKCTVIAPNTAPATKLDAIRRLGAEVVLVTPDEWWTAFSERRLAGVTGHFIHAFDDMHVMQGNATIAREIIADCPDVDAVLIPWGGGGLVCGVATAMRQLRPQCRIIVCEVETAAPFHASFRQRAVATVDVKPSFVDGIGSKTVFQAMFDRALQLVDDALTVSVEETAAAIRMMVSECDIIILVM